MYVYFIKTAVHPQMLKIGKASNIERRMAELQTGCPYDLELVGSLKCLSERQALGLEKGLHRLFRHARARAEWFQYHRWVHMTVMAITTNPVDRCFDVARAAMDAERVRSRRNKPVRAAESVALQRAREYHKSMDREFVAIVG